ncbi:hypothetical protein [Corynebacterium simulans]|nr:hypothetical protein [Corynebacterium simulans]
MQSKEWHEEIIANIGKAIDNAREGKSDRWISERTEKLGNPLSRTAVSEYRRGVRKTISIGDWLVLAAALGVPPVSLLFPELPDGRINLLPATGEVNQLDALMWIAGERQTLPSGFNPLFSLDTGEEMGEVEGRREYRSGSFEAEQGPLDLRHEQHPSREQSLLSNVRQMQKILTEMQEIQGLFDFVGQLGEGASRQQALETYINRLQKKQAELEEVESRIETLGGVIREEHVVEYGQNGER